MGELITLGDDNELQLRHHFTDPVIDGEQKGHGLVPRNYDTHPAGCYAVAPAFDMGLIPESEWADRISEQEKNKSSLQHIRDQGNFGGRIPSYDQDGKGYCWAHSSTSAVTLVRALNNQPYVPLSAFAVACIIKGFRDQGGWGAESLEFIASRGIPSSQFWPMQSMSQSNDNPQTWTNAKEHVCENWMELAQDQSTVKAQLATCLLLNIPVVVDFNWWSHSVCAVRLVKANPFTIRIWNSWSDSWSDAGMGDLTGSKAIPDGAVAPRVMTASTT